MVATRGSSALVDQARLAKVGEGKNIVLSLIEAAGLTGNTLAIARPPDYQLSAGVALANLKARFMHWPPLLCGPQVIDAVIERRQPAAWQQPTNPILTERALLYRLLRQ